MGKKFLRGINVSFLLLIIISTFSSCANEMNVFEGNNRLSSTDVEDIKEKTRKFIFWVRMR